MKSSEKPGLLKTWWISVRPFSFTASVTPLFFGSILAVTHGGAVFNGWLFVLTLLAMVLLQAGANVWNDVCDFRQGLDREVFPVSGGVVRGLLTVRQAVIGSCLLFGLGSLLGLMISYFAGWPVLVLGIVGVAIGILYSVASLGLKYNCLGDLAVFLNFGIFGSLGSWLVQARKFSWLPVIWAVPVSLLVIGILHANNWRDLSGDREGKVRTVASYLGDHGSVKYFSFLVIAPYILVLFFMLPGLSARLPSMPLSFLATFLSFPLALALLRKAERRVLQALDGETAKLNLLFGVLCVAALLLDAAIS